MNNSFSSDIIYLDPSQIQVNRPQRQRTEIDTTDLIDSIRENGVINPIIVRELTTYKSDSGNTILIKDEYEIRTYFLIAGERRLESCRKLDIKVPCRIVYDGVDLETIELEENLKRQNLSWRDESRTIAKLHNKYLTLIPTHTMDQTAKSLSLSKTHITHCLTIAKYLDLKLLNNATSINQAIGLLTRFHLDQVETISAVIANNPLPDYLIPEPKITANAIINTANLVAAFDLEPTPPREPECREAAMRAAKQQSSAQNSANINSTTVVPVNVVSSSTPPESLIKNQDIKNWILETGGGDGFNFIHLDADLTGFDEILSLLVSPVANWLMQPNSHIMIWYDSIDDYEYIIEKTFYKGLTLAINQPFIWFKPDIKEYSSALIFGYQSDQKLNLRPYIYPAPTSQISTDKKPESMLRFFFSKIMTKDTNFFDPCCGNGASLRAADSIGVNSILGLESNPDLCLKGNELIQRDRLLRRRF